jgi:hypothetical protein
LLALTELAGLKRGEVVGPDVPPAEREA